jgi:hypothetical protein
MYNKKTGEKNMTIKGTGMSLTHAYNVVADIKLWYDYKRDENFDWAKSMREDYISFLWTKAEELGINYEDYADDYTPDQIKAMKIVADDYDKQAKQMEQAEQKREAKI